MAVVLVGFMGAGKTTVGTLLAAALRRPFFDSDQYLEQQLGRTVREVFAADGEARFRQLEHEAVQSLLAGPDAVIALGGGALGDPRTREALATAVVVYLRVSYAQSRQRLHGDEFRPLLHRPELDQVYRERLPIYEELAQITVDTDGWPPAEVVAQIAAALAEPIGP